MVVKSACSFTIVENQPEPEITEAHAFHDINLLYSVAGVAKPLMEYLAIRS